MLLLMPCYRGGMKVPRVEADMLNRAGSIFAFLSVIPSLFIKGGFIQTFFQKGLTVSQRDQRDPEQAETEYRGNDRNGHLRFQTSAPR